MYVRGDAEACPNPLSIDPYSKCGFNCKFCFIKEMEQTVLKRKASKSIYPTGYEKVKKRLMQAFDKSRSYKSNAVKALRAGMPVTLGRKCDPFCKADDKYENTKKICRLLSQYGVDTFVEVRGVKDKDYINELSEYISGFLVGIAPGRESFFKEWEDDCPSPERRWQFVQDAKDVGLWVGVKGEPLISSVNDDISDLEKFTEKVRTFQPDNIEFCDYHVHNVGIAKKRIGRQNLFEIFDAKENTYPERGEKFFSMLKDTGVPTTSADWVNFGLQNDRVSCCGLDEFGAHMFNFNGALMLIQRNEKVKWDDIKDYNVLGDDFAEKFNELWNEKEGHFSLSDVEGVNVVGRDRHGNKIFGTGESEQMSILEGLKNED